MLLIHSSLTITNEQADAPFFVIDQAHNISDDEFLAGEVS